MSQLGTRLSSRAQLMRAGRLCVQPDSVAGTSDSPVESSGPFGTTRALSLVLGASTPCSLRGGPLTSRSEVTRTPKRIRCSRGRGTGA